jgi:hypothetical protein
MLPSLSCPTDNLFSGSVPSSLFLPHLESIALPLNCFEHELPSSICDARDAGTISMDGLGSATGCKNVVTVPFTSVSLVRSLGGNIPDCVWSLSKLKILNLAGNGLRGTIGTTSSMPSLISLALSHNYLSGKIPLWLQKMNLSHLDLSHNKLTGDANGFRYQDDNFWNSELVNTSFGSQYLARNLSLIVNRLSGDLPESFGKYEDLDILSGNLFGCANFPKNDENSDYVSCGSREYDQTMVLMGGVLGAIVCLFALSYFVNELLSYFGSRTPDKDNATHNDQQMTPSIFIRYLRYHTLSFHFPEISKEEINQTSPFQSTISFGSLLSCLMNSLCLLTILCLLLSIPIYVLKQLSAESEEDPQYITHTHMYNWLWTMAFLSGNTPAIILLAMCFVSLFYFTYLVNRLGDATDLDEKPRSLATSLVREDQSHFLNLTVWIIFILNIGVVGTVNGLYLWSTLLDLASDVRTWIQFSFGLFIFFWSFVLRRGLPSKIKESKSGVWLFTCLHVMNSVIIPCIVTSLSSPSCYQVTFLSSLSPSLCL